MSDSTARKALALWGLKHATLTLIAQRENIVYRVDDLQSNESWALRLHRAGLRNKNELLSECQWMQALSDGGLSIPVPVETAQGDLCMEIDGHWVDVQKWLTGDTISTHLTPKSYRALGTSMAQLHTVSDRWTIPEHFQRPAWSATGLLGELPVWGPFWENPNLDDQQRSLLKQFRTSASDTLLDLKSSLDYGLIHADLVSNNVLIDDQQLHLIDFDDSGYGFRLFDLATVILRLHRVPQHVTLTHALIEGYQATRELTIEHLDLFLALRACTYVGWIIPRMDEPAGIERCARFIETACAHTEQWLDKHR